MNKTRIAAALAALAVAAYAAAGWYAGKRIERYARIQAGAAAELAARRWPALRLQVEMPEYRRGILFSDVRHTVALSDPQTGRRHEFAFASRIAHGPLPITEILRGRLAPVLAAVSTRMLPTPSTQAWFDLAAGTPPASGRSRVGLGGGTRFSWRLAPLDGSLDGVTAVRFSGATAQGEAGPGMDWLRLAARTGKLQLREPGAALALQDAELVSDTRRGRHGIDLGEARLSLQSLSFSRNGSDDLTLRGLALRATLDEDGNERGRDPDGRNQDERGQSGQGRSGQNQDGRDLAGRLSWTVEGIAAGSRSLGSLQAALSCERLDARALRGLLDAYAGGPGDAAEPVPGDEDRASAVEAPGEARAPDGAPAPGRADPRPFVQALLAREPVLTVEPAAWTTPEGRSEFHLKMSAAPGQPLRGLKSLDARLSVSRPMAAGVMAGALAAEGWAQDEAREQARERIDAFASMALSMGLARQEGDDLVARLAYADGILDLNGEKIDAARTLSLLGMAPQEGGDWGGQGEDGDDGGDDDVPALDTVQAEDVTDALQANGFRTEVSRDDAGDPVVTVTLAPQRYGTRQARIEFYGCAAGGCEDILLHATVRPARPVALKTVNDWNSRSRWVRAYLDEDRQPVLEMDINAYGGIGEDALESLLMTYFAQLADFAQELGVEGGEGTAPAAPAF